jgi:ornithine cyclodeaminase/alanine dehydrogenase-like protein (mu-crystallin family)
MADEMLVLGRQELESLEMTMDGVVDILDDAFHQKARGLVQNPPKPAVHPRSDAFINAMPAYLGGSDRAGIKWVAGYETNRARGLPYIYGVFILTDAETGRPLALMDGGWITEMRTAGASGVVLRHVPDRPRSVAIVGAGVQGRRHLDLVLQARPDVEVVRAYDHGQEAIASLFALAGKCQTIAASSAAEAIIGADLVITTVTAAVEPRLEADTTAENALLLPVDYDDAMSAASANGSSLFVVDDLEQYRSVAHLHFHGFREPDAELAQVVAGEVAVPANGRRMFLNMGIAMDDVALGGSAYDRARERGIGRTISFP